jgi:glycosyltransferase involved in cell wall biosynthesis
MKYSFVVVTYNRKYMLEDCLKRIAESMRLLSYSELLIVDNCSTDGTQEFLKEFSANVPSQVLLMDKNYGAISRNRAFEKAQGEWIVQVDDDTLINPRWEDTVMPYFTKGVGGVGPMGVVFHDWNKYFRVASLPAGSYVDGLVGYFWVFQNEGWRYDERYQIYMEETEMQMQMRQKGYRFRLCEEEVAQHLHAGTKSMDLEVRNSRYLRDRWQPLTKELNFEYAKGGLWYEKKDTNL